jgi:hypothetical protein
MIGLKFGSIEEVFVEIVATAKELQILPLKYQEIFTGI